MSNRPKLSLRRRQLPTQRPPAPSTQRDNASAQLDAEAQDAPPPHDEPVVAAAEPGRGSTLTHEFKSEKWVELYSKRVDETIAALKSKGVPVFWVGLPPIRGARSMGEMAFLNDIFRARAEKAGAIYVDVWDGFVDDGNRFAVQGPDFEGQVRRLRTADGVHFTAGRRAQACALSRKGNPPRHDADQGRWLFRSRSIRRRASRLSRRRAAARRRVRWQVR